MMTAYIVNDLSYSAAQMAGEICSELDRFGMSLTAANSTASCSVSPEVDNTDVECRVLVYVHNTGNNNSWSQLKDILEQAPSRRVIIVANRFSEQELRLCIAMGAYGYLINTGNHIEVKDAIEVVDAGGFYLSHRTNGVSVAPTENSTLLNPESLVKSHIAESLNKWGVTPRQRDVAEKLLGGMTNKEIAEELSIEVGTVKVHLRALYKKFNISSRYQFFRMMDSESAMLAV